MKCPKCGKENIDGAIVCVGCGEEIEKGKKSSGSRGASPLDGLESPEQSGDYSGSVAFGGGGKKADKKPTPSSSEKSGGNKSGYDKGAKEASAPLPQIKETPPVRDKAPSTTPSEEPPPMEAEAKAPEPPSAKAQSRSDVEPKKKKSPLFVCGCIGGIIVIAVLIVIAIFFLKSYFENYGSPGYPSGPSVPSVPPGPSRQNECNPQQRFASGYLNGPGASCSFYVFSPGDSIAVTFFYPVGSVDFWVNVVDPTTGAMLGNFDLDNGEIITLSGKGNFILTITSNYGAGEWSASW